MKFIKIIISSILLSKCKANYFSYIKYINDKNLSYSLADNKFSNVKFDKFKQNNGFTYITSIKSETDHKISTNSIPTNFDWRDHGVIGEVKDQSQCGSCWAFSAVGALESQLSIKHEKNYILSEQEIVDCVVDQGSRILKCCNGCSGGEMSAVYEYLSGEEDDLDSQYPYTATDGTCKKKKSSVKYNVTDYVVLKSRDEDGLMHSLYNIGPISIGVNANRDWQLYSKGIYSPTESQCPSSPYDMDHGVVLVGYGEEDNIKYWTIRNSWGSDWGENGYIRITRGKNTCGIANSPIYPVVD